MAGVRGLRWLAGCALLALALGGCGASGTSGRARAAAARPTPTPLPQPGARCGTPDNRAQTLRFPARDGVSLDGAIVGTGPIGVVLLHEYPGPMCGWWPYANYLAHRGVQALLFDLRCFGLSACPADGHGAPVADVAGAMAALRSHGARSIALVGASMGGIVSVTAGAALDPDAIVDLSGERNYPGLLPGANLNAYAAAARLHAPALFVVAHADPNVSVGDMRAVYRRARSRVKQLTVLPATAGHGWDMLSGRNASWSPLARRVVEFVEAHAQR